MVQSVVCLIKRGYWPVYAGVFFCACTASGNDDLAAQLAASVITDLDECAEYQLTAPLLTLVQHDDRNTPRVDAVFEGVFEQTRHTYRDNERSREPSVNVSIQTHLGRKVAQASSDVLHAVTTLRLDDLVNDPDCYGFEQSVKVFGDYPANETDELTITHTGSASLCVPHAVSRIQNTLRGEFALSSGEWVSFIDTSATSQVVDWAPEPLYDGHLLYFDHSIRLAPSNPRLGHDNIRPLMVKVLQGLAPNERLIVGVINGLLSSLENRSIRTEVNSHTEFKEGVLVWRASACAEFSKLPLMLKFLTLDINQQLTEVVDMLVTRT